MNDESPKPSHPNKIKMMLSLIISKSIDETKQIKISENCLNSILGIYTILKIRIMLEINITVDINKVDIQSMSNLTEKFIEFLSHNTISREIKIFPLNKNPLIINIIIDRIIKIKKVKIVEFMAPQAIVLVKLINYIISNFILIKISGIK